MEGKQVIVFYDDGGHVSRKDGVFQKEENNWVHLVLDGEKTIVIDRARIIRIEVVA